MNKDHWRKYVRDIAYDVHGSRDTDYDIIKDKTKKH